MEKTEKREKTAIQTDRFEGQDCNSNGEGLGRLQRVNLWWLQHTGAVCCSVLQRVAQFKEENKLCSSLQTTHVHSFYNNVSHIPPHYFSLVVKAHSAEKPKQSSSPQIEVLKPFYSVLLNIIPHHSTPRYPTDLNAFKD